MTDHPVVATEKLGENKLRYMAPINGWTSAELREMAVQHFPHMLGTNRVLKGGVTFYAVVVRESDPTDPSPWFDAMLHVEPPPEPVVVEAEPEPEPPKPKFAWRKWAAPLLAVVATAVGTAVGGVDAADFLPLVVAVPALPQLRRSIP